MGASPTPPKSKTGSSFEVNLNYVRCLRTKTLRTSEKFDAKNSGRVQKPQTEMEMMNRCRPMYLPSWVRDGPFERSLKRNWGTVLAAATSLAKSPSCTAPRCRIERARLLSTDGSIRNIGPIGREGYTRKVKKRGEPRVPRQ